MSEKQDRMMVDSSRGLCDSRLVKTCGYCGRENEDDARNCKECGTELVEPAAGSREQKERRSWPDLGLRYAGYTLVIVLFYLLSFGPMTYFFGKVTATTAPPVPTTTGVAYTYSISVQYPGWLYGLYYPAFMLYETDWGSETYGRYVSWWYHRALRKQNTSTNLLPGYKSAERGTRSAE
jgi:hypothetical protein